MIKTNRQKYVFFFIASVIMFSVAFMFNSTGYLSSESDGNFDWWSESLTYADLLYSKEYPDENQIFNKSLSPSKLADEYGGEWSDYENQVRLAYKNSDTNYKKSDFGDYTSNIVIQRYFFRFFDNILPISNSLKIHLFHLLNCLLFSISLSVVICWIIKVLNSFKIGISILALLSLFAPNLIMYGKNLYWCAWTLFLPTVVMIILLGSKWFNNSKHKILLLSIFATLSIIIKCLFYFEFISVVMISMMIPVIYYLLNLNNNHIPLKKKITFFLIISFSAVIGFLFVIAIKFFLLNSYCGNSTEAFNTLFGNLQDRLLGNTGAENSAIVESANASFINVLRTMLQKPFVSIKSVFTITQLGAIIVSIFSSVMLFLWNKKESILSQNNKHWIICCWVSLLAPISWFVMAKPHTYIHNHHCSITWFIIFDFMALSLFGLFVSKIAGKIVNKAKQ